jgi:tetratricopeptide (TPR) repeat protein
MKLRPVLFILLFAGALSAPYAQSRNRDDAQVARQYVQWARQAIDEERWDEALAALRRSADFASVSSDISYLLAVSVLKNMGADAACNRLAALETLDRAIETNRWDIYNPGMALLLKAEQLVVMRNYAAALSVLEQAQQSVYHASIAADLAYLRLLAFRGLTGNVQALARFRSLVLSAMDRFPRDSRPLRVFFEYARNRNPEPSGLPEGDLNLIELALRRLPFLLEDDPDLAWMASFFMSDTAAARRLVSSYRAGGLSSQQVENFRPNPASISAALNLGLIDDTAAVEELFSWSSANGETVIYRGIIGGVYNLLRSEQGRDLFTRRLLSFSGTIFSDDDGDGHADSLAVYKSGVISEFRLDRNQSGIDDLAVFFAADGVPLRAHYFTASKPSAINIDWERYPSVLRAEFADEVFLFRPADFQYAPITFIELGGSQTHAGTAYPVPAFQNIDITRRSLVSFCTSVSRPSVEINGAVEQIFLERGVALRSVETLDGRQVSVTEFEKGAPLIQRIDLDLDGRMETIRRFHRPGPDFPWPDSELAFDYRRLIASSESDWTGEGRFKTGEVYLQDGSVVYSWDVDGSGVMNHSETENRKE